MKVDPKSVAGFFDAVVAEAPEGEESGYLADGWPVDLSVKRFEGEWRTVRRWLERHGTKRDACLDVGCGTGLWLEHLAPLYQHSEGIDLSEGMVSSAQKRLAVAGLNTEVKVAGVDDLDSTSHYDLVFVGGVLMYFDDEHVGDAITKLRGVLSADGLLLLRESTYRGSTYYRDKPLAPGLCDDPDLPRAPYKAVYRTPAALRSLLGDHGIEVMKVKANRDYKLVHMKQSQLRFINRLLRGRLADEPETAERWAKRTHYARWLSSIPAYHFCRFFRIPAWNMENHWFVCRAK